MLAKYSLNYKFMFSTDRNVIWLVVGPQRISPYNKSVEKSFNENGVTFLLNDMTLDVFLI